MQLDRALDPMDRVGEGDRDRRRNGAEMKIVETASISKPPLSTNFTSELGVNLLMCCSWYFTGLMRSSTTSMSGHKLR